MLIVRVKHRRSQLLSDSRFFGHFDTCDSIDRYEDEIDVHRYPLLPRGFDNDTRKFPRSPRFRHVPSEGEKQVHLEPF